MSIESERIKRLRLKKLLNRDRADEHDVAYYINENANFEIYSNGKLVDTIMFDTDITEPVFSTTFDDFSSSNFDFVAEHVLLHHDMDVYYEYLE